MIAVLRAEERGYVRQREHAVWLTFDAEARTEGLARGFGALEGLREDSLAPGAAVSLHMHVGVEIITYVREGALTHRDAAGHAGVIRAGEFQRMTAGRGVQHREGNASRTEWAHFFQIALRPTGEEPEASYEQRRFCVAERRGVLCVVASPDGRRRSLHMHEDTLIYSAVLDPGQHVIHPLAPTRSAWLHIVRGEANLSGLVLSAGDGVGVTTDRAVSLTARTETEVLLVDLGEAAHAPPSARNLRRT